MKIIVVVFLFIQSIVVYGQEGFTGITFGNVVETNFIIISSRALSDDYGREIKIDKKTGDVYCRKSSKRKFKLINEFKNDPSALFLKDSITYDLIDSLVLESAFDILGYKIEFISKKESTFYPNYTTSRSIEFGKPHDPNNLMLKKIIEMYVSLRYKAKV